MSIQKEQIRERVVADIMNKTNRIKLHCLLIYRSNFLSSFFTNAKMGRQRARNLVGSESGPTAVEYAVVAGVILMASIAAITVLGQGINSWFNGTGSFIGAGVP